jgi:cytochrome c oxidase assembly protein subunit 15
LLIVVILAALTASAGWIMVMSGLVDRPWVNAYKLTLHFILAILTIAALVKTIADVYYFENKSKADHSRFTLFLLILTFIQLILAGLMSGMKAALYYPTWPSMNGKVIPEILHEHANWTLHNLTNYDSFEFAPALIQFSHRLMAYILLGLTMFYYFNKRNNTYTRAIKWLTYTYTLALFQIFLGILTLIKSKSGIPILYAVLHQLTGLLFFISLLFLHLSLKRRSGK